MEDIQDCVSLQDSRVVCNQLKWMQQHQQEVLHATRRRLTQLTDRTKLLPQFQDR